MSLIAYQWNGEAMVPLRRFQKACDARFVIGEVYTLDIYEGERTDKDHGHYFAIINAAWQHLPEPVAGNFPSPEHLRKFALIMTGYRRERSYVAESANAALLLARAITEGEEYAVVNIFGRVVQVLTAETQKYKRNGGMGKARFHKSKQDVLDYIAGLIGVTSEQMVENFKKAA